MTIGENLTTFFGKPVRDFETDARDWDFAGSVPRFREEWDSGDHIADMIGTFAGLAGAERADAIVIGFWEGGESSQPIVEALVGYKERLAGLRALFLGDTTSDENEISWIRQSDLSALWAAFPHLEHVQVRGATELVLGRVAAPELTTLIVESGGLPMRVIREALAAEVPQLRHFELWLGSDNYGADSSPDDFAELFAGSLFPKLRTLALRDCAYADDLAAAVANAAVLERIDTLDLSMGNLTDAGAEALLASPRVKKLQRLDLHHHFLSDATMQRLQALGPQVDLSEQQEEEHYGDDVYRNIAVSE